MLSLKNVDERKKEPQIPRPWVISLSIKDKSWYLQTLVYNFNDFFISHLTRNVYLEIISLHQIWLEQDYWISYFITGSSGSAVKLITNYIGFKKKPDSTLFKYRVDFRSKESEELETWIKKTLFAK